MLINNTGSINQAILVTKDGLQFSFPIHHLGHFLLSNPLMPLELKRRFLKIIDVSLDAHEMASPDFTNHHSKKSSHPLKVIANEKLYNILLTWSLMEQ